VLVGFSFNVMLIPRFFCWKKKNKKIAIQTQTSIPLKPRLLPFNHIRTFFFYRSNSRINRWLLKFVCPVVNSIRKQTKKKNVESSVIEINNLIETNNKREREREKFHISIFGLLLWEPLQIGGNNSFSSLQFRFDAGFSFKKKL
jgi:hypothetical protein